MIKFYEVAPEYREEPIDDYDYEPGYWLEKVSVIGNSDYKVHKSEAFVKAEMIYGYIIEQRSLEDITDDFEIKNSDALTDVLSFYKACGFVSPVGMCSILRALTDEEYFVDTIRGCCQGEWNRVYYPDSMGEDFLEWFETAYFNNGSEWIVEDEDSRISVYSCEWNEEKMKVDLADQCGVSVDECEFYKFNGWKREPDYKKI